MSSSPAPFILAVIASVAATVWLIAANYLANSPGMVARRGRDESGKASLESRFEAGPATIVGGSEIEGEPAENSRKLAAVLVRNGLWQGGPLEIVERRDDRIAFSTPGDANRPRGQIIIGDGNPGKTRFDYHVEYGGLPFYLKIGWMVQALALLALATGFWVLRTYAAASSNPAVWGQSFQLIQVGHFLWPPFLFGYVYRSRYRLLRRHLDTILKNLPHSAS